ncbi:MAG: histidine kinase [Candidatus Nanopelagicales bacterium]
MGLSARLAAPLTALAVVAAAIGLAFLGWRLATPSECAWLGPDPNQWVDDGVRASVTAECALRPGTTVTGAHLGVHEVALDRAGAPPVTLALNPSGPLLIQRLSAAAPSVLFASGLLALGAYAAARRRVDVSAATLLVAGAALWGSTVVTFSGIPVHQAFGGGMRWLFVVATQPVYLLAWGASLAWLILFPAPALPARRVGAAWIMAVLAPVTAWALIAAVTLPGDTFTGWMRTANIAAGSLTVATLAASIALLIARLRASLRDPPGSVPRQQLLWVAGSALASGFLTLAFWMVPQLLTGQPLLPPGFIGAPGLLFVVGLGVALLRYRLFDLDAVLGRTLVYAILIFVAVVVYLTVTGILAAGFQNTPTQVAVVGAVSAAILVNPLRVRLERAVNRALYGARDDPYSALSRIAATVAEGGAADARTAEDIRSALRAPFAEIHQIGGMSVTARDPKGLDAGRIDYAVEHNGARVGTLSVGYRAAGERFSATELRLLADIARQLGAGLYEQGLARDLRESRERIGAAREQERRSIRRELHDDVGPLMAAVSLEAETARRLVRSGDTVEVDGRLDQISHQASQAAESIRRLSYELRPPVLDEHGLVDALQRYAAGVQGLRVRVDSVHKGEAPPLSPAVESAVYRIVVSAVTNARRHAGPCTCEVRLRRLPDCLEVVISDDGAGLPRGFVKGVGIIAMQERAAELGGTVTVSSNTPGVVVRARIPTEPL